ncbi:MAG: uracil-DNA glycosylase [Clostridia bacterium]|nr:uracil-DNA glycosylase [Clostridia bacterium]
MRLKLTNDWQDVIGQELEKPYFKELEDYIAYEYMHQTIYPEQQDIMNALKFTPYEKVKVVILGQDPYHGPGQAHGLSFSVKPGVKIPPSLRNIYKELNSDFGAPIPSHGYLKHWADQGVLLLNTVLTVRAGLAHSHTKKGWEKFTDAIIKKVCEKPTPVVFILWGNPAQEKAKLITNPIHLIVTSVHPSPLSVMRGFYGSKPFTRTNEFLVSKGQSPIDWTIENL